MNATVNSNHAALQHNFKNIFTLFKQCKLFIVGTLCFISQFAIKDLESQCCKKKKTQLYPRQPTELINPIILFDKYYHKPYGPQISQLSCTQYESSESSLKFLVSLRLSGLILSAKSKVSQILSSQVQSFVTDWESTPLWVLEGPQQYYKFFWRMQHT